MEMIILPLSYRETEEKEKRLHEAVDLAVQIQSKSQQVFALAGILTFTGKIIDRKTANSKKLIEKGYPTEEILSIVPGCTKNEVEALRKSKM